MFKRRKLRKDEIIGGAIRIILLKTHFSGIAHIPDTPGVKTELPYDAVVDTRQNGAGSIGSSELHQNRDVPCAVAIPV
jgi:hypothetical protein